MFTAAPFTIAKTWKPPKCPSTEEWMKTGLHMYTVECYPAKKKKDGIPATATPWMDLEGFKLRAVSQRRTNTV